MIYTELTNKALKIMFEAHKDQKDQSGIAYVFHPYEIATKMDDEISVCIALLHDVIEDTNITIEDLEKEGFPKEVLDAVELLTHRKGTITYLDYIRKIKSNPLATKVKIADLHHNMDDTRIGGRIFPKHEKYVKALKILTEK